MAEVAHATIQAVGMPAWEYYSTVQTKDQKYTPLVRPEDKPATFLNATIVAAYREKMKPFYFDPSRCRTCLEQLGVPYPPPVSATGR